MNRAAQLKRLADNLGALKERIRRAAGDREIRLVCVTKYARLEWIELLLNCGAEALGENLLPAAAERFGTLRSQGYRFEAHLIGAQQSRKLRLIPGSFDCYQALDRLEDADELQRRMPDGHGLSVLLQVKTAAEEQKRGCLAEHLPRLLEHVALNCPALHLRGLMTIPPGPASYPGSAAFEQATRRLFGLVRQLFDRIAGAGGPYSGVKAWDTLSMGMSQDFDWAIQEGATMVRVGTALFEGLED